MVFQPACRAARNRRSPEYLRLHGLPENAANETHEAWVARIHPEDRERTAAASDAALAGGPRYDVEYRIVRSDGLKCGHLMRGALRGLHWGQCDVPRVSDPIRIYFGGTAAHP